MARQKRKSSNKFSVCRSLDSYWFGARNVGRNVRSTALDFPIMSFVLIAIFLNRHYNVLDGWRQCCRCEAIHEDLTLVTSFENIQQAETSFPECAQKLSFDCQWKERKKRNICERLPNDTIAPEIKVQSNEIHRETLFSLKLLCAVSSRVF